MTKRILVTGGAGFIGSHLCERLLGEGCDVLCVDNFSTGSRSSIEHLLPNARFEAMRHDVTRPLHVEVDEIYNLACPAAPVHYQHDPVHTTKSSLLGAINMLGLAKRLHARVLQASTCEVYGDPHEHPQSEEYRGLVDIRGPRACYEEGKRTAETVFFDYHRMHRIDVRIARIFNTYGPRMHQDDGRVVSNFIVRALQNAPIEIAGDGEQTRSFCFVDDMVEGLVRLMNSDRAVATPVNLGSPFEISILALAEKIRTMTGSRSRIVHKPQSEHHARRRCPDITRAAKLITWHPRIGLDDGLRRTIAGFETQLASGREAAAQEIGKVA
jgi:UDP-glucuronate decarboxylase